MIVWNDKTGGLPVVTAISNLSSIEIEVSEKGEVAAWDKVLKPRAGCSPGAGDEVTIAIIEAALKASVLVVFAGVLAYAIGLRYVVEFKKTKTTIAFRLKPAQAAVGL